MNDATSTLADLRHLVRQFVRERQWEKFHAPKNLAMSLAIEAAELMEHFQWISAEESRRASRDPVRQPAIAEELADVVCYALALANEMEIDLAATVAAKMRKNEQKYPVAEFRGRYGPEDCGEAGSASHPGN